MEYDQTRARRTARNKGDCSRDHLKKERWNGTQQLLQFNSVSIGHPWNTAGSQRTWVPFPDPSVGMSGTKFLLSTSLSSLGNKCMIQRKWLRHTQNELNSFLPAFLFPTSYLLSHSLDCLGRQVLKATFWDTAITFQSGVHSKDKSPSKLKTDWWVAI